MTTASARLRTLLLLFTCGAALAQGRSPGTEPLQCEGGPSTKTFGGTKWLVYACSDNESVAIVADAGNPAQPFYFFFAPEGNRYRLVGEGTGSKAATQAAFNQLSRLGTDEVKNLLVEAQAAASTAPGAPPRKQ